MTTKIAIEGLRSAIQTTKDVSTFFKADILDRDIKVFEMGIEALKYRDPQEVKRKGSSYYCPRCNNNLSSAVYIENKCCHECGQKLYWRPVDETKT